MMKMRLLAVVLFVLGAAGVVLATDVINVDIKGYNDNTPYIGNGAYDVGADAVWIPFSGGWGVPVGSARSESLVPPQPDPNFQCFSSVYAAQVWIGDDGKKHGYQYGSGLMDDGFTAASPNEPNISIWGQDAYQGVYDIYVYGRDPGLFRLTRYGVTTTQTVSGDANAGEFKLGQNYVVFSNVDVNSSNPADLYLTYTNKLNALQFVKKKSPFVIEPNALGLIRIEAGKWDVAGHKNSRGGTTTRFGPNIWFDDVNGIGMNVGYLEEQEFMDYDINVNEANEGQYQISLGVLGGPKWPKPSYSHIDPCSVFIYLDDRYIGEVNEIARIDSPAIGESTKVTVNLDEGTHSVRWFLNPPLGAGKNTGFDLAYVKFTKLGNIVNSNCADVARYGFTIAGDLNGDCTVDLHDLDLFVDNWMICNNPDPNGCF